MSALEIKSYVMPNDETAHCVNARDLWISLKSKRIFADWIKDRLNYTQAENNVDYFLEIEINELKRQGFLGL